MLHTFLTTAWNLRYPLIGAPMVGAAGGRLAHAVSQAGALGMIGVGNKDSVSFIEQEAAVARGEHQDVRFGIGLMTWAIEARPELLEAAIRARPFVVSLSFGSPAPYVASLHQQGILVATQVNTRAEAVAAAQAGVDLIVVQGTEAGGHTGHVSTLPLLQAVLDSVQVPVLAAGGIASPRGVAAALAAGAEGVWVGTGLLACPESNVVPSARERILQAQETDTILTRLFDQALGIPWPQQYPGRALQNSFTAQWQQREEELSHDTTAQQQLTEAIGTKNYDRAYIYAGEAVALVTQQRSAAEVVRSLCEGAEQLLHHRCQSIL